MLRYLRREPGFYKRLFLLALPLILQNLITTSLGFVDTFMVGLLGDTQLSAVTAANAPIFLVQVIIFGLMSGLTILVSQFWGKGDVTAHQPLHGHRHVRGLHHRRCDGGGAVFLSPAGALPGDGQCPAHRHRGPLSAHRGHLLCVQRRKLRLCEHAAQRGKPLFGMLVFAASMLLNTFLNYCFIFGRLGAPALGVTGAAIATLTSRVVESSSCGLCAAAAAGSP